LAVRSIGWPEKGKEKEPYRVVAWDMLVDIQEKKWMDEVIPIHPRREDSMNPLKRMEILIAAAILAFLVLGSSQARAEHYGIIYELPEGVYIELTKEFYDALKEEGGSQGKTYSNEKSQEYLRQIAISAKFMVQTNLQILKNQEKIIQLLEATIKHPQKKK